MKPMIYVTQEVAELICDMAQVCYIEGILPDTDTFEDVMLSVEAGYPSLVKKFEWWTEKKGNP